ncbi:hypothetical protein B0H14DRAFT_2610899 [Mycena olivaceomarginata]|nr:hypothetical protein B0H14DRAFT_2610899 [Mycena olivaceomarginata]
MLVEHLSHYDAVRWAVYHPDDDCISWPSPITSGELSLPTLQEFMVRDSDIFVTTLPKGKVIVDEEFQKRGIALIFDADSRRSRAIETSKEKVAIRRAGEFEGKLSPEERAKLAAKMASFRAEYVKRVGKKTATPANPPGEGGSGAGGAGGAVGPSMEMEVFATPHVSELVSYASATEGEERRAGIPMPPRERWHALSQKHSSLLQHDRICRANTQNRQALIDHVRQTIQSRSESSNDFEVGSPGLDETNVKPEKEERRMILRTGKDGIRAQGGVDHYIWILVLVIIGRCSGKNLDRQQVKTPRHPIQGADSAEMPRASEDTVLLPEFGGRRLKQLTGTI